MDYWVRTKETGIRITEDINAGDKVTLIFTGSYFLRQDFIALEDQTEFEINTSYARDQHIITTTGVFSLQTSVEFNPGQGDLLVWLNGILQKLGDDYIEDHPSQFTFTNELEIEDRIIVIIMGQGSGSYIREDQVPDSVDQNRFILQNDYAKGTGTLLVYLNGQLLVEDDDYIEDSNNAIETTVLLNPEDKLTFLIFEDGEIGSNCCNAENVVLGTPTDGSWNDGLINYWNEEYHVNEAIDDINEVLKILGPNAPTSFTGKDLELDNGFELYAGYVSDGNTNYENNPGDFHDYLTESNDFYIFTPTFIDLDKGEIKLFLNSNEVDSFSLYNAFVVDNAETAQSNMSYGIQSQGARESEGFIGTDGALRNSTTGRLSIMNVEAFQGFKYYQIGKVRINIEAGFLRNGYNEIYLTHEIDTEIRQTNVFKVFYDNANSRPELVLNTITLESRNIYSNKYLSGIRYFSIGDTFRLTMVSNYIYSNTYTHIPVKVNMPGIEEIEFEYDHTDLQTYSDPPENTDIFQLRHDFPLDEPNQYDIDARMRINTYDPFGEGDNFLIASVNRLIHTYTNGSTDLIEHFRDEKYRLPIDDYDTILVDRINQWDSSLELTENDALLFNLKLQYGNIDFSSYRPTQTANYSGRTLPQVYIRSFYHNKPHNNGTLYIDGLDKDSIKNYTKIKVEIKLPSQTGWMDLSKDFDIREFNGNDGDGCLLRVEDTNKFLFTTEMKSTAYSGYMTLVKITLYNVTSPIINYMELIY